MKFTLVLISSFLLAGVVHGSALLKPRVDGGYVQNPSGAASFTCYSGCSTPACGKTATGYTAAMNQLSFGAPPSGGGGDACGRCFRITGQEDPYTSGTKGPFNCIVVKVTDLCPGGPNNDWCGQTVSNPVNSFGQSVHFDLCQESEAAGKFFPLGIGALTGKYEEVSCTEWSGSDGPSLWGGACLADENTANWPSGVGCGNAGTAPA